MIDRHSVSHPAHTASATASPALGSSAVVKAAIAVFLLGAVILMVSGFMPIEAIHDAAHDSRHSFAFPCH